MLLFEDTYIKFRICLLSVVGGSACVKRVLLNAALILVTLRSYAVLSAEINY